jgi:hypothetical protein
LKKKKLFSAFAEWEQGKADFSRVNLSGETHRELSLEMPILTSFGGMTKKRKFLQARKTNRIDEFSERGQTDKFPLKNGDLFTQ